MALNVYSLDGGGGEYSIDGELWRQLVVVAEGQTQRYVVEADW